MAPSPRGLSADGRTVLFMERGRSGRPPRHWRRVFASNRWLPGRAAGRRLSDRAFRPTRVGPSFSTSRTSRSSPCCPREPGSPESLKGGEGFEYSDRAAPSDGFPTESGSSWSARACRARRPIVGEPTSSPSRVESPRRSARTSRGCNLLFSGRNSKSSVRTARMTTSGFCGPVEGEQRRADSGIVAGRIATMLFSLGATDGKSLFVQEAKGPGKGPRQSLKIDRARALRPGRRRPWMELATVRSHRVR